MNAPPRTAVCLTILLPLLSGCPQERPSRSFSEELAHSLASDTDWRARKKALEELGELGGVADDHLPAVIEALESDSHEAVRAAAVRALILLDNNEKREGKTVAAIVAALSDESLLVRRAAAQAVQWIGPDAEAGVPRLLEFLADTDDELSALAVRALSGIGEPALPALAEARSSAAEPVRGRAAQAIAAYRAEQLNSGIRQYAAEAALPMVDLLAKEGPAAIPFLERVLKKSRIDYAYCKAALEALGGLGEPARSTLEAALAQGRGVPHEKVVMTLNNHDRDQVVRLHAAVALGRIHSVESLGPLSVALLDEYGPVRGAAALSLGRIGEPTEETLAALLHMLQNDELDSNSAAALDALRLMAPASLSVRKTLTDLLDAQTGGARIRLLVALARIESTPESAAPPSEAGIPDAAWLELTAALHAAVRAPDDGVERTTEDEIVAEALASAGAHEDADVRRAAIEVSKVLKR